MIQCPNSAGRDLIGLKPTHKISCQHSTWNQQKPPLLMLMDSTQSTKPIPSISQKFSTTALIQKVAFSTCKQSPKPSTVISLNTSAPQNSEPRWPPDKDPISLQDILMPISPKLMPQISVLRLIMPPLTGHSKMLVQSPENVMNPLENYMRLDQILDPLMLVQNGYGILFNINKVALQKLQES